MGEIKRLGLSFYLSSPLHREAWRLLEAVPLGQRTELVCLALVRANDRRMMLEAVRDTVKESMGCPTPQPQPDPEPVKTGSIGDDVLDFLRTLQNGGDVS